MTTETPPSELPSVERTSVLAPDTSLSPSGAERLQDALAALLEVRAPSLAPLVRVSPSADGVALTHLLPVGAVPLAELRRAAPLRAGHVLTVVLAVVDALVVLTDAGLAHGGVDAEHVLVAPDGTVLLSGTGLAWRRPPGDVDGPRPTDDVAAAGDLVRDLLGRAAAPSPLVLAALRASDGDPGLRPSPAELREVLARCGRAAPLGELLTGGPVPQGRALPLAPPPRPSVRSAVRGGEDGEDDAVVRAPRRVPRPGGAGASPRPSSRLRVPAGTWRPGRRSALLGAGLALVALGALRAGVRAGAEDPASAAGLSMPSAAATPATGAAGTDLVLDRGAATPVADWSPVLAAIDAGRLGAIARGSVAALRDWVDPAGPAWAADAALAARVSSLGARIVGGGLVTVEVRPQSIAETRTVLLVRDRREAYSVVTPTGTSRVPARSERWWRVTLSRAAAGATGSTAWRVHDVAAAGAPRG